MRSTIMRFSARSFGDARSSSARARVMPGVAFLTVPLMGRNWQVCGCVRVQLRKRSGLLLRIVTLGVDVRWEFKWLEVEDGMDRWR